MSLLGEITEAKSDAGDTKTATELESLIFIEQQRKSAGKIKFITRKTLKGGITRISFHQSGGFKEVATLRETEQICHEEVE